MSQVRKGTLSEKEAEALLTADENLWKKSMMNLRGDDDDEQVGLIVLLQKTKICFTNFFTV